MSRSLRNRAGGSVRLGEVAEAEQEDFDAYFRWLRAQMVGFTDGPTAGLASTTYPVPFYNHVSR